MAEQELSAALKEVLDGRGVLSEVQARLRAEVYKALQDESIPKPELCEENLLINELIREYLQFNQYKYTDSVLVAETGQHKEPLERNFIAKQLHIPLTDSPESNMPLLYHMLTHFRHTSTNRAPTELTVKPATEVPPKTNLDSQCFIQEPSFPDS